MWITLIRFFLFRFLRKIFDVAIFNISEDDDGGGGGDASGDDGYDKW